MKPRLRAYIFYRDKYTCQICGSKKKIEVDHVEPNEGPKPSEAADNLQTACFSCNRSKRNRQTINAREVHAEIRKRIMKCDKKETDFIKRRRIMSVDERNMRKELVNVDRIKHGYKPIIDWWKHEDELVSQGMEHTLFWTDDWKEVGVKVLY